MLIYLIDHDYDRDEMIIRYEFIVNVLEWQFFFSFLKLNKSSLQLIRDGEHDEGMVILN